LRLTTTNAGRSTLLRSFFMPLFTNVVEGEFSEVQVASVDPTDHSRSRRSALVWAMRSLSAGLTSSLSRKARASAIDLKG
jgi:hypothetical protein